jgi:hypothetical protein
MKVVALLLGEWFGELVLLGGGVLEVACPLANLFNVVGDTDGVSPDHVVFGLDGTVFGVDQIAFMIEGDILSGIIDTAVAVAQDRVSGSVVTAVSIFGYGDARVGVRHSEAVPWSSEAVPWSSEAVPCEGLVI